MIRLFNAYFPARTVLLTVSEGILLIFGFLVAVFVSEGTANNAGIFLFYENGVGRILFVVTFVLVLLYYFDLYNSMVLSNRREIFTRLVGVLGVTFWALALFYFAIPGATLHGTTLWIGIVLGSVLLTIWRSLFLVINRSHRFAESALILGDGPLAGLLHEEVRQRPELGIRIAGAVLKSSTLPGITMVESGELTEFVRQNGIRRIIVTMKDRRGTLPVRELLDLKASGVRIEDGPEFYESVTGKLDLDSLRLGWLVFSPGFHVSGLLRLYKRMFSLLIAGTALIFAAPVMAIVAIAIRLDSKGPVLFSQPRVGESGRIFTMYKFRSMYDKSELLPPDPAAAVDPRITRIGRWIRPRRLDELPQLFNILKGDMAFVGPRPFVPAHEEKYAECIPFYRQRWLVKPGATGWAQINRGYNETVEENRDKLAYDLFYIRNISIGLDIYIIASTAKIVLLGRGR